MSEQKIMLKPCNSGTVDTNKKYEGTRSLLGPDIIEKKDNTVDIGSAQYMDKAGLLFVSVAN